MSKPAKLMKYDIIHHLATRNGYRSYLEICTPTTGLKYAHIDRTKFDNCHRLMYRYPDSYNDGMDIDFKSATLNLKECMQEIRSRNLKYDVIFVDPFHSYDASLRDLNLAANLLNSGGSIVVHDCLPPSHANLSPTFVAGSWGGVTYKAYVDFLLEQEKFNYFTVDTDWGCGVIQMQGAVPGVQIRPSAALIEAWKAMDRDYQSVFQFLLENKKALLNLISADEFVQNRIRQF